MIIEDDELRHLLLDCNYNSLNYEDGLQELTVDNRYDTSKYIKPIASIPENRSSKCVRIICDDHYAIKVNKASHIIMNYHSKHSI